MKYLCLGYFSPAKMDAKPAAEIDALMSQCPPHLETLHGTGQVLLDAGLANESRTLRRVGGRLVVEDSPGAESERLGAVFLIEAAGFDDAVRVAALHPTTQLAEGEALGWRLEVRPVSSYRT